jgi:hypothetical protein
MKDNLQKILPILSTIFLILCFLVFYFLNSEINNNKKIFEESELRWQEEADRRDGIKILNSSVEKIQKEKELLETHFAKSSNAVPFLDIIESLGKKVGVSTEVTLVDIPKETKVLVVEMRASGSFSDIYRFLLLLENSPYELETISVDLQKLSTTDSSAKIVSSPKWSAVLRMKLLSFLQ